ncbi:MAG TPA: CpsB/CapC family capsule biosynthesis tyrosine phosphatase [Solirubrobacteraceae bacterium]|nr:CpsB/CapC family capsule biosynthesis tyrosine phosphatase [Solirubrobacteraceae bacterium]
MIDLHFHLLAGIDDGPGTVEQSLALARAACAGGVREIVATPHVSWEHDNRAATIAELTRVLSARVAAEGIELRVRSGAEVALTRAGELSDEELSALALGGAGGEWLLVECPFTPAGRGFDTLLLALQRRGYRVLIAHPERCPAFHRDPEMLRSLVGAGMLTSITAGSLVGRFGGTVRRFTEELVREQLVHNVVSDAHDLVRRPPGMTAELAQAGLGELAQWLTVEVPGAILAGEEFPVRPAKARVGGALRRALRSR